MRKQLGTDRLGVKRKKGVCEMMLFGGSYDSSYKNCLHDHGIFVISRIWNFKSFYSSLDDSLYVGERY